MSQQVPESDQALAARAARGDEAAFVALYDRLFEPVYDFLLRLLLSRRKAAMAVLSTFLRLRRRLSEGRWRGNPRLVAMSAAYQAAIEDRGEQAAGAAAAGEEGEEAATFAQVDPSKLPSPRETSWAQEEAPIVWEAAASLDRREYALLDLHLRHGLNAIQVGPVVGMGRIEAWSVISRLKKAGDEALTSLLMLRLGRRQCPEMEKLAAGMGKAILPPESRRLVSDHALICPTCLEIKMRLVPPLKLLAALLPVAPASGVKEAVLQDLLAYTAAQAGPSVTAAAPPAAAPRGAFAQPRPMGPPPQRPRGPVAAGGPAGGPAFAILMGAAAVLALPVAALAIWLTVLSGDGGGGSVGAGPTSTAQAGAALEPCGSGGLETPGLVTCTPTPTSTPTATSTPGAATKTPAPTETTTPSPTAPPIATATNTPAVGETPTGIVETATPKPSPGPHGTATAVPSPAPARSPSPSPPP